MNYPDGLPSVSDVEFYLSPWFYLWCFLILSYILVSNYRDGNNVRNAYRLYIFSVALWLTGGHLGVVGSIAELLFYALGSITTLLIFAEVHHEGNTFSSCRLSRDES